MKKICPFSYQTIKRKLAVGDCRKEGCELYFKYNKQCSIKMIAFSSNQISATLYKILKAISEPKTIPEAPPCPECALTNEEINKE